MQVHIPTLIRLARDYGLEMRAVEDRIHVKPAHLITPEWREVIRSHKPAILAVLRSTTPP